MFHVDTPLNWEEVLDRDGMIVVGSSMKQFFVIEKATNEDRVVALVSTLDAAGKIEWREEEVGIRFKTQRYRARLPGSGVWQIGLSGPGEYDNHQNHHLYLSGGKDFSHLIYNPQELVRNLYYRVHERFGHPIARIRFNMRDDYWEEKRKVVAGGLAILEEAIKNV